MKFTREQLLDLSQWNSLHPDFDRNRGIVERQLVQRVIKPFLNSLDQKAFAYTVIEDGGLTNYYAIWIRETVAPADYQGVAYFTVPGVTVYLSLLGPFAAIGRKVGDYFSKTHHMFQSDVFDPEAASSELESGVVESLSKTRYTILKTSELAERVPDDIQPYECDFDGPYTVFNVMFSNTD